MKECNLVCLNLGEKEVPPPELVVRDSSTSLELPPSSDYRSVSFCLLCVCAVEEVTHQLGKQKIEYKI